METKYRLEIVVLLIPIIGLVLAVLNLSLKNSMVRVIVTTLYSTAALINFLTGDISFGCLWICNAVLNQIMYSK